MFSEYGIFVLLIILVFVLTSIRNLYSKCAVFDKKLFSKDIEVCKTVCFTVSEGIQERYVEIFGDSLRHGATGNMHYIMLDGRIVASFPDTWIVIASELPNKEESTKDNTEETN